jgi:hypothetical protein
MSAYRAERRANGKDAPRPLRLTDTDGHIPRNWFRNSVWVKAVENSGIGAHVTPHGLRHAHASWLLAGGADIQVVKDRLGHGSILTTQGYLHTLPDADDTALKAMDNVRGMRGTNSEQKRLTITAEQYAEYETLKNASADQPKLATTSAEGEQRLISAAEYAELAELRSKIETMKAVFA